MVCVITLYYIKAQRGTAIGRALSLEDTSAYALIGGQTHEIRAELRLCSIVCILCIFYMYIYIYIYIHIERERDITYIYIYIYIYIISPPNNNPPPNKKKPWGGGKNTINLDGGTITPLPPHK